MTQDFHLSNMASTLTNTSSFFHHQSKVSLLALLAMHIFKKVIAEFGGSISVTGIAEFIDNGGNVLIATSPNVGDAIRDLATEVGIEVEEDNTFVIDDSNFDVSDDGKHSLLVIDSDKVINAAIIVGNKQSLKPILYRGIGLVSDPKNPLVLNVVTSSPTAYSQNPSKADASKGTPKTTLLVAGLQARNNARVLFSGSLDLFSDSFFKSSVQKTGDKKYPESGNKDLAISLSKWVFKEEGLLRFSEVDHRHASSSKNEPVPDFYTVTDDIMYSIKVEIFKSGQWIPFDAKDIQLEFVRIDPFVRQTMKREGDKYVARFKVPDVYGVYKFVVDYNRIGYTHLYSSTQVSVRPLRHTQYERFIRSAYPYYFSAFSMMAGTFLFAFVFLYHKDTPAKDKSE